MKLLAYKNVSEHMSNVKNAVLRQKLRELAVLKSANRDRDLFSACASLNDFLFEFNKRFNTDFTEIRRYEVSPEGKVLFSTPDSKYRSSFSLENGGPRFAAHDQGSIDFAMAKAVQGEGGLCDAPHHAHQSFLVYPEKNINGHVTHVYLLGSERLKKTGLWEAEKLITRLQNREFSFEKYLAPIFLENQPVIKSELKSEILFFIERLEQWFYLADIELKFLVDERLVLDFKNIENEFLHCVWSEATSLERRGEKEIPHRFLTVHKQNPLLASRQNQISQKETLFLLDSQGKYWSTLTITYAFNNQKNLYRHPTAALALMHFTNRFSWKAADSLAILNHRDHITRILEKNKQERINARLSFTGLPNRDAFNLEILKFFENKSHLNSGEYLSVTFFDAVNLGFHNESLGHETTDEIINHYAEQLSLLPNIFHLQGDEFANFDIITDRFEGQKKIEQHLERISEEPFIWQTNYFTLAAALLRGLDYSHKIKEINMASHHDPLDIWQAGGLNLPLKNPVVKKVIDYICKYKNKIANILPENAKRVMDRNDDLNYIRALIEQGHSDRTINTLILQKAKNEADILNLRRKRIAQIFENFPRKNHKRIFDGKEDQGIELPISLSMTAGTVFISDLKFKEIKNHMKSLSTSKQKIDYLRDQTLGEADALRINGRSKNKHYSSGSL